MRLRTPLRLAAASLVVGFATVAVAPVAGAATDTVSTCSGSGAGSLPAAVAGASAGDTVTFSVSCPPGSPIVLSSTINIGVNLTIDGPGGSALAVSGNHSVGVFNVPSGVTAIISGITIEDGNTASDGGGIDNAGAVIVTNSTVSANNAGVQGGGINNGAGGTLIVLDGVVSNNTANGPGTCSVSGDGCGGGIYNDGVAEVTGSTVSGNSVGLVGGGIASSNGGVSGVINTLTVIDSTLSDNSTNGSGGAIYVNTGSVNLTGSTLSDNIANYGGGMYNNGPAEVTNSTIVGNTATLRGDGTGGGIYNVGYTTDITSSTVSDNAAKGGGGIENPSGTVSAAATIVADSPSGNDCSGPITDAGYNLDDDGTCGFGGTSLTDTPAGLDSAGLSYNGGPTQTIALETGSAAIGAVTSGSLCSALDQRDVPRPTPCDVGAVELVIPQAIISVAGLTTTIGSSATFTVTTSGTPLPKLSKKGKLPKHVTFVADHDGTATISGTPTKTGTYNFTIKATFGTGKTKAVVTQAFTLTVNPG